MDVIPLVGRDRELAAGVAVIDQVVPGSAGAVIVIEGEPGIGKSRLATELASAARERGFTVLAGTADELGSDRPFGPLLEALGPDAPDAPDAPDGPGAAGELAAPGSDLGFAVAQAAVDSLERLAADGPVLLMLDDLQWADPSTVRATVALSRAAEHQPLVLVLTARTFPRSAELDGALDNLEAHGALRVALEALTAGQASDLAAAAATAHGRPGPASVEAAGGNPLLILELAAVAAEGASAGLPPTLQAGVRRRLRSLPRATVEVLRVASVLGRRFRLDQLAAVTGQRAARLTPLLRDALAAGVLGEEDGELVFRHDLIRDAIYLDLAIPLRQGLHRDAARTLTEQGYPALAVAEHLVAGAGPGDAVAVDWLRHAAAGAAARAPQVAVRLFEHALALAETPSRQFDEIAADLAPLLVQVGRASDAAALSRTVLAGSPSAAVEAMLRRGLGEVLWTRGWLEPAVGELDGATAVPGVPAEVHAEAAGLAAYLRSFLGQPGTGPPLAQAQAAGDFSGCVGLQTHAVAAASQGHADIAVDLARRAVAIAVRSPNPRVGILHPHLTMGLTLFEADCFDEAERTLQEGRRRAEQRGAVAWLPLYHSVLALGRLLRGDWDDALAEVESGMALADEVGTRLYTPFLLGTGAWVAVQRDDLDRAQAHMEQAVQEFLVATTATWQAEAAEGLGGAGARWPLEWGLWVNALLHEARGFPVPALADLTDAWASARPLRYFLGYRLFAPDLVRLAVAAGDRAQAAAVVAEVQEGARRSGRPGATASALRCRGLLDDDAGALAAAADALAATSRATEAALTAVEAGAALARAGREAEAVERLETARAFYEAVGGTRALARVDAALRALGVRRRRTGVRAARSGWDALTGTELRVARLAAEGLTNRQIGERLFVSPRTVETHLGHAFAKLGVATRAQLAAEAARRD